MAPVWDRLWRAPEVQQQWSAPSPEVAALLHSVSVPAGQALDVGCGTGRHIATLLTAVKAAIGLDSSLTALRECQKRHLSHGLRVQAVCGSMASLPFADRRFSFVLSFNVVYHSSRHGARRAILELMRCCSHDGVVLVTLLSTRNKAHGLGIELEPGTFVRPGEPGDRGVIHHFFSADDIVSIVGDRNILEMVEREPIINGAPDPRGNHWFVLLRPR